MSNLTVLSLFLFMRHLPVRAPNTSRQESGLDVADEADHLAGLATAFATTANLRLKSSCDLSFNSGLETRRCRFNVKDGDLFRRFELPQALK